MSQTSRRALAGIEAMILALGVAALLLYVLEGAGQPAGLLSGLMFVLIAVELESFRAGKDPRRIPLAVRLLSTALLVEFMAWVFLGRWAGANTDAVNYAGSACAVLLLAVELVYWRRAAPSEA